MKISLKDMGVGEAGRVMGYAKSFLPYRQKLLGIHGVSKQNHSNSSFLALYKTIVLTPMVGSQWLLKYYNNKKPIKTG